MRISNGCGPFTAPSITPLSWPFSSGTATRKSTSHYLGHVSGALTQLRGRIAATNSRSLRAPGSEYLGVQSPGPFQPHDMDSVKIIGAPLRHVIISTYSGADEKQKLEAALALAPPWLPWFTFADYTAKLLNLTIPDLSEAAGFMRSKANFDIWWGLPMGAFQRAPWPHGSEHEPLARTDLNLLRPTIEDTIRPMTRRELMRKRAALQKSDRGERQNAWPPLIPVEHLKLSRSERISLTLRDRDFHHASIGRPRPGSTTRFR